MLVVLLALKQPMKAKHGGITPIYGTNVSTYLGNKKAGETSVRAQEMAMKNYSHKSLLFALQSGQVVVSDPRCQQSCLISCT